MLTKTLDPKQLKQAEQSAERKYGPDWRSQRLDHFFGPMIEYPHETALSRKSYLLATAPQQEAKVEKALRDAGLDAYLPVEPKSIRVGHIKRQTIKRPMLPGYVFPIFDVVRDNWQIIRKPDKEGRAGIEGVLRLFLWGERPVPMPEEAIQRLRDREIEAEMRGKAKPNISALFVGAPGDFVQIDDGGPWNGFIGKVIDLLARGRRISVSLDLFGRQTPVEVSVNQVRSV